MRSLNYIEGSIKKTCEHLSCGKTFYFKPSPSSPEAGRFCSYQCWRAWQKENKGQIRYTDTERSSNPNVELHRKFSIQWQKDNPDKVKAQGLAKYHTDKLFIAYECPCEHPKKQNHHPDYSLPLLIIKLCPACHAAEHKRLRALAVTTAEHSSIASPSGVAYGRDHQNREALSSNTVSSVI